MFFEKGLRSLFAGLIVLCVISIVTAATISTDKIDYSPEETVYISGQGFDAGASLLVKVTRPDNSVVTGDGSFGDWPSDYDYVTADPNGEFQFEYILDGILGEYLIEVLDSGNNVLATATFTDAAIWTTRNDCGIQTQDVNHFAIGEVVYINGGNTNNGGGNFDVGTYNWDITGKPGGASCDPNIVVASGTTDVDESGAFCFAAYTIQEGDCGEYQVKFGNKGDNYGVDVPEEEPVFEPITISGYKFEDVNGDGFWDQDEPALANWEINLNADEQSALTDINGYYEFTGLGSGTYTLDETLQDGWIQTTENPLSIDAISGHNVTNQNFGNFELVDITIVKDTQPDDGQDFHFTATGGLINFYLDDDGDNSNELSNTNIFTEVGPGVYNISENVPMGWLISNNIMCEGGDVNINKNLSENTMTLTITTQSGVDVSCTFVNELGPTRTQGFWSTHHDVASKIWLEIPEEERMIGDHDLGDGIGDVEELMGGFWANIAKKTSPNKGNAAKRSDIDQARMQLLQQLLAAMLNRQAFGTSDGGLIEDAKTAFEGDDKNLILSLAAQLDAYNNGGDAIPFPEGFDQGKAKPKTSQGTANKVSWDVLP